MGWRNTGGIFMQLKHARNKRYGPDTSARPCHEGRDGRLESITLSRRNDIRLRNLGSATPDQRKAPARGRVPRASQAGRELGLVAGNPAAGYEQRMKCSGLNQIAGSSTRWGCPPAATP